MNARAVLATSAIVTGTVTAHSWAGGELPSVGWTALVCALVFAATRAVFRGQVSARVMVVGLAAAEFGLHALLTALAAQPMHHLASAHHAAGSPAGLGMLSMSWQMAMAHALTAVLTVMVWSATAAALEDIVQVPDQPHLAVRVARAGLVSDVAPVVRTVANWRSGAPRRGPPRALLLQCA
jgi:hypothetical protein